MFFGNVWNSIPSAKETIPRIITTNGERIGTCYIKNSLFADLIVPRQETYFLNIAPSYLSCPMGIDRDCSIHVTRDHFTSQVSISR
jgi:hypothetical protein